MEFLLIFQKSEPRTPGAKLPSPDLRMPVVTFRLGKFFTGRQKKHPFWGPSFLGGTPKTRDFLDGLKCEKRKQEFLDL